MATTMYNDLVKKLRYCGNAVSCIHCPYWEGCAGSKERLIKAADVIEELQKITTHYEEESKGWWLAACDAKEERERLKEQIPKWISVEERLPEEYKDVLCYYEYFRYGDFNRMFRTIDRGYYGDGRWGGEAGQGHKNKVLAWMPLPEPPKEE